ncbi:MAG: PAS domain-containing protein [Campylobacterales bacterium]|nr:PAS domain-containing protein [Campylobacterales bacterium]
MPDMLVVKDQDGKFLFANENVAKLYKTTPEDMIGKDDADFGLPQEMADYDALTGLPNRVFFRLVWIKRSLTLIEKIPSCQSHTLI